MSDASEPPRPASTRTKPRISGRWRRIGGTRRARRRCCTGSIRCGSNIFARQSIIIGARTRPRERRWRARRAADVGCGAGLLAEPLARLGRGGDRDRRGAREYRGGAGACGWAGAGDRLSRRRRGGAGGALRSRHLARGGRACRGPGGLHRRAGGGGGRGRAADPLDAEPDDAVEAAAGGSGRGDGANPERHARLGQVHHARRA